MNKRFLFLSSLGFLVLMNAVLAQEGYLGVFYKWAGTFSPDILIFKAVFALVALIILNFGLSRAFPRPIAAILSVIIGLLVFRFTPESFVLPFTQEGTFSIIALGIIVISILFFLFRWFPLRGSRYNIWIYVAIVALGIWFFIRYSPYFMWSSPLESINDFLRYGGIYSNFRLIWGAILTFLALYIVYNVFSGRRDNRPRRD